MLSVISVCFTACKKEVEPNDSDTQAAENNAEAEYYSSDAISMSDMAAYGRGSFKSSDNTAFSGCATVTKDTLSNPRVITIDFGSVNCECNDGRFRRGKIIITYTGKYFEEAATKNIAFEDYYINDNHVEGSRTVTNKGLNDAGNPNWSIEVKNMKVTAVDGAFFTWNSTRNREMIAGYNTLFDFSDDAYSITGSANGINKKGLAFSATITKALLVSFDCRWIKSGIVEMIPAKKANRSIDYGDGTCDNEATVFIKGKTHSIKLK